MGGGHWANKAEGGPDSMGQAISYSSVNEMRLTNEVARTGWKPKVDSAGIKFQVYLSHSGMPKPKNWKDVYGDTQNTIDAQGEDGSKSGRAWTNGLP